MKGGNLFLRWLRSPIVKTQREDDCDAQRNRDVDNRSPRFSSHFCETSVYGRVRLQYESTDFEKSLSGFDYSTTSNSWED